MRYGHSTLNRLKTIAKTMDLQVPKNDKATVKPKKQRKDALVDDDESEIERESDDELSQEEPRSIKQKALTFQPKSDIWSIEVIGKVSMFNVETR